MVQKMWAQEREKGEQYRPVVVIEWKVEQSTSGRKLAL